MAARVPAGESGLGMNSPTQLQNPQFFSVKTSKNVESVCRYGSEVCAHRSEEPTSSIMILVPSSISAPVIRGSVSVRRGFFQGTPNCSRNMESPRIPVVRPDLIRSVSPLADPESTYSLPESDVGRLRWLNRFTPRWNETSKERRRRLRKRAEGMRTRRAHTERILNSFQRLDSYTSTVLPSDLMVCLSYNRFQNDAASSSNSPTKQLKMENESGIYLTPNRILHPFWTPYKKGVSTWVICHRDSLQQPKKLRSIYRHVREPKFYNNLGHQISSQLVRRVAQECVVLRDFLITSHKSSIATRNAIVCDHPVFVDEDALAKIITQTTEASGEAKSAKKEASKPQHQHTHIGGIAVFTSQLFTKIANGCHSKSLITTTSNPDYPTSWGNKSPTPHQTSTLMFSLNSASGPIPVWNIESLLKEMAKQPSKEGATLTTAAIGRSAILSNSTQLCDILADQMHTALWGAASLLAEPSRTLPSLLQDSFAYLIPLSELSFPLLLALRRATWWLGQGYEVQHLAGIDEMTLEAETHKSVNNQAWDRWLTRKATVTGKIKHGGELWVPSRKKHGQQHWKRV
ncbi:hypothetical protein CROQUDRAFT_663196 [Cronartium quercuum f. sp. fusiforme G11]|uniref:Uncharacterized protein n=1 Tax=Cronartium quercuum f. sp. fusiforme G11 TaxID=708437 RepID=A0A9P6N9S3_9BASI|nr:hypothetical protein CROQUDRAFT_663196 [Cronartium quercuum f. sp. fusiforme G11]